LNSNLKAKGVLVLGAGGHGKSVVAVLIASGATVTGVLDDTPENWGKEMQGVPILGPISDFTRFPDCSAVIAQGDNAARRSMAERFPNAEWARVLDPRAPINPTAIIARGTVIFPLSIISPGVIIGEHVIVSGNVTVGHDTILEDYVHVAPGVQVAGGARVGQGAMLGIGSIVCPKVHIGEEAILGAGAVAVADIPASSTAFGVPARVVRLNTPSRA
jgi:sugar O-acyltransferase (sialic acid O-acetyltransferase NeuD family)